MNNGINLAINKKAPKNPILSQLRILRFGAIGILAGVALISMLLFFLIAASPLPGLKKQENSSLFQVSQLHPKIAKYLLINERVAAISELMKNRDSRSKDLQELEDQMPTGANIDTLKVDDKGITVNITSTSLETLNSLIANILAHTGTDKDFTSFLLNSLAYDVGNSNYHISLSLTL